jgi:hypothetical protein
MGWLALNEPAVAISDVALALVATACAVLMARAPAHDPILRRWFVGIFGAVALSSLLGGLDHGFLRDPPGAAHAVVWPLVLLAIGAAGLALAGVAIWLSFFGLRMRRGIGLAALLFAGYAVLVLSGRQDFSLAIAAYLPATLWLLAVLLWRWRQERLPGARLAASGLALTLAASAIQHFQVDLPRFALDHNTLYHLVEIVALVALLAGAHRIVATANSRANA